ncbi:MAG TPA: FAD-dependent oxidoreductase, partial [Turneriella sp.]|nr:FAD-dependent oxidoreductase [Turneriella sp.]
MKSHTFDIAVLGAGPAGSASALFLAQAGFRVALIEKRRFAKAGPSWVNGIYLDSFDEVGLAKPAGEEIDL